MVVTLKIIKEMLKDYLTNYKEFIKVSGLFFISIVLAFLNFLVNILGNFFEFLQILISFFLLFPLITLTYAYIAKMVEEIKSGKKPQNILYYKNLLLPQGLKNFIFDFFLIIVGTLFLVVSILILISLGIFSLDLKLLLNKIFSSIFLLFFIIALAFFFLVIGLVLGSLIVLFREFVKFELIIRKNGLVKSIENSFLSIKNNFKNLFFSSIALFALNLIVIFLVNISISVILVSFMLILNLVEETILISISTLLLLIIQFLFVFLIQVPIFTFGYYRLWKEFGEKNETIKEKQN